MLSSQWERGDRAWRGRGEGPRAHIQVLPYRVHGLIKAKWYNTPSPADHLKQTPPLSDQGASTLLLAVDNTQDGRNNVA